MDNCCHNKEKELAKTAQDHSKVLWTVLIINMVMFGVELFSGLVSDSTALIGDSLDMFGDSVTYASSLFVVGMSFGAKAKVARLKAYIMIIFGALILARSIYRTFFPSIPDHEVMFLIGSLALVANLACLFLLTKFREDDINMRSVWICSRNDIIANVSVLLAAILVLLIHSPFPDLLVGAGLAVLFVHSAIGILKEAKVDPAAV
jgi:Co/Zn/Cd efflux system component